MKRYYPGKEQKSTEHPGQSEDKPTGDVPKSRHEDSTICFRATDSTLTSEEESYDTKNHCLTLTGEKDELIQNSKKVQSATNWPTSEDKAMKTSNKKKSIKQQANDIYFIKKIKRQRGQKEIFIKWQNFPHNELTQELEENLSPKAITENYFKESLDKESQCDASICANVQFGRQNDESP